MTRRPKSKRLPSRRLPLRRPTLLLPLLLLPLSVVALGQTCGWQLHPGTVCDRQWKTPVPTATDLPTDGNLPGDVRTAIEDEASYLWTGSEWTPLIGAGDGGGCLALDCQATEVAVTLADEGDVGIGTATPAEKLHLSGGHFRMDPNYALRWGGDQVQVFGASDLNLHLRAGSGKILLVPRFYVDVFGCKFFGKQNDAPAGAECDTYWDLDAHRLCVHDGIGWLQTDDWSTPCS